MHVFRILAGHCSLADWLIPYLVRKFEYFDHRECYIKKKYVSMRRVIMFLSLNLLGQVDPLTSAATYYIEHWEAT